MCPVQTHWAGRCENSMFSIGQNAEENPSHVYSCYLGAVCSSMLQIYMLDFQIWYTVMSAICSALIGAWWHLGEVRLHSRFHDQHTHLTGVCRSVCFFCLCHHEQEGRALPYDY